MDSKTPAPNGKNGTANGELREGLRSSIRWSRITTLLASLVCAGSALWNVKVVRDQRIHAQTPNIILNPPPLALNGENGFYYTVAAYAPKDGYTTIADALKAPQAAGMTEAQFRDAIVAGKVTGPSGRPIRTINGFFNDWIIPEGFNVLKPGAKIPPIRSGPPK